jgi:hypothetical protein
MMESAPSIPAGVLGEHPDRRVRAQRRGRKNGRVSGLRPDFTSASSSLGMESSETRQGEWYLHLQSCVGELVRGPKWEISDRLDCS